MLIVGAGSGGALVLREIVRNPELRQRPVGFVDDDPRKQGMRLEHGVQGAGHDRRSCRGSSTRSSPTRCMIAIPSAPGTLRARVVSACRDRGIPVRTLPTVFELLRTGGQHGPPAARRRRSRTCSAASRCAWSSSAWAPTSRARSCW